MRSRKNTLDYTLLLFLAALFLFHSPFSTWWSSLLLPWYTIFIIWLAVIVLVAINQFRRSDDRD